MNKVSIIIGGDIVPTSSNLELFESGQITEIVSEEIMEYLENSDIRIFNLETPICDKPSPIEKEGPCFLTSTKSIEGIKQLNPTLLTLANNHILDQGAKGLISTIEILNKNNISYVGVGDNLKDANNTYFIEKSNYVIGIYACVEHEYSIATRNSMGANPFDPFDSIEELNRAKNKCDILIVLYHGGKEYYEYPSPELQKRCHKMVEAGADIILCQHSHCVGTSESYMGAKILYGQGNFILDKYIKAFEAFFQTGLIVKIDVKDKMFDWELIPIKKEGNGIRLATKEEAKDILNKIDKREEQIKDDDFVETNFREYANLNAYRLLFRTKRFGYILSSIDNRFFGGKLLKKDFKKAMGTHSRLAYENILQCETHNEMLRTYLKSTNDVGK